MLIESQFNNAGQGAEVGAAPVAPTFLSPDHQIFLRHIAQAPFQIGCDRSKWRLLDPVLWPQALIAISAPPRLASPSEWVFRFDLTGYPNQPPTAGLWDVARHTWLDTTRWPVGTDRFALAFNPGWQAGQAVYAPCDRNSIAGHPQWINDYPHMIWAPDKDISFYLDILHDYFHSNTYQGARPA